MAMIDAQSATHYTVRVAKDYLVFCAGHFITYGPDHCERIHGHNYRVAVEIEDDLDPQSHYVFDFITLKRMARGIVNEFDHTMLLATENPRIALLEDGDNWEARYRDRRWSFPRDECTLMPIANTTAELMARYIAHRLLHDFDEAGFPAPRVLRVELEETFGQSATFHWRRAETKA